MIISTVTLLEGYNADEFWKKDCTGFIWDFELETKNEELQLGAAKNCGLEIGEHKGNLGKYSSLVVIRDGVGKNNGEDTRRKKFMGELVLVEPKEKEPHDHDNIDKVYRVKDGMRQCKLDGPSEVLGASTRSRVKARLKGHKDKKCSRELYADEQPSLDGGEDEILQHMMWNGYQSMTMEFGEVLGPLGGKKMIRVYQKLQEEYCTCMCIGMVERIEVIRDSPWKQGKVDTQHMNKTTYYCKLAQGGIGRALVMEELKDLRMRKTDWLTFMKESGLQVWDIWRLESQVEAMWNYHMEARLGWLRHINSRSRVAHKEHKTEARCYREVVQERGGQDRLADDVEDNSMDMPQGSASMEEDDIKRRGRYVAPEYDESNAHCVLESHLDSGTDQTYDLLRMDMLSPDSDLDGLEGTEDGEGESQHGEGQFGDVAMGIEAGKSDVSSPDGASDSCKNGVPSRMELITDGGAYSVGRDC
jgi:hypothetical protein